jgi:hypothetical protein
VTVQSLSGNYVSIFHHDSLACLFIPLIIGVPTTNFSAGAWCGAQQFLLVIAGLD